MVAALALAFGLACGGGSSDPVDAAGRDGGRDGGRDVDGRDASAPSDDGGEDAGTPPGTWAPLAWEDCEGGGRTLEAGPDDYRAVLDTLEPGDVLRLRAGDYARGLPMRRSGEEGRCLVVEALDPDSRPRFLGSDSFNVLAVHGASWIKLRNLDVDGLGLAGFGVASQGGTDQPTHHVVIEGLRMVGLGGDQQIVGISTKSPASDWVIRGNRIEGAGTGLYLGNSDGSMPFVRGLIEFNTVIDSIGYAMQIKHQNARPAGMPTGDTIVRRNVFAKTRGASTGGNARPNVLFGHFPTSGDGQTDRYVVYGNLFYDNATENLLQAEGNLVIVGNAFVNPSGGAVSIQPHNDVPREVDFAFNTVVATGLGVSIRGGASDATQRARYNAIFAATALSASDTAENVTGSWAEASSFLRAPAGAPGVLDLHPLDLEALAIVLDAAPPEATRDFDGVTREAVAGAFSSTRASALTLDAPEVPR
ncbi:MAG: hypothetical protein H6721_01945 [Sandaracinus sp.]|nr:hypothetical protein [Sandaracinus sp.]